MRAIWNGSLNFGLLHIPVKLYSGAEERGPKLSLLHKTDRSPIRYARVCRKDGKEIPYAELTKGYEYQRGDYIILSEKDFQKAKASLTAKHAIDVIEFTDEKTIDVRYFQKPYYLEPAKNAEKAYNLLTKALQQSGKVAIAKIVLHNREHIAAIKPIDSLLVLDLMRFEAEIQPPKDIKIAKAFIGKKEMDMALALINQLTEPFAPKEFHDTYREKLEQVIKDKVEGHEPLPQPRKSRASEDIPIKDLVTALQASLANAKRTKTKTNTAHKKQGANKSVGRLIQ